MEWAYSLAGGAPVIKKYQVAATAAYPGIPMLEPAASGGGVVHATTTGAANVVGFSVDISGAFVTAQQTDGTSAERLVSLIINPDAVMKARLSGGAAENTALTLLPITTASTDGLTLTTAATADWGSPTFDEGVVWGYDGANAGQNRKVISVSSTVATVQVAFDYDTVVGDNFLRAPFWPLQGKRIQLTTLLTQVDASIAVGTGCAFKCIDLELRDLAGDGRNKSFVHFISDDHGLRETT